MRETRKHTQLGFSVIVMRGTGPMARAALEAIGLPSEVEEVVIEQNGGEIALGGIAVSESDARLVYAAWQCGPHPFRDLPRELDIERIQRSITIRQMLEQANRGKLS